MLSESVATCDHRGEDRSCSQRPYLVYVTLKPMSVEVLCALHKRFPNPDERVYLYTGSAVGAEMTHAFQERVK